VSFEVEKRLRLVGRGICYAQGLILYFAPSFVGKLVSPLGYRGRYPAQAMAFNNQFQIRHLIILTTIVGFVVAGTSRGNPLVQTMLFASILGAVLVLCIAFLLFVIGVKMDGDVPKALRQKREAQNDDAS